MPPLEMVDHAVPLYSSHIYVNDVPVAVTVNVATPDPEQMAAGLAG